jgi:hypothetical protein
MCVYVLRTYVCIYTYVCMYVCTYKVCMCVMLKGVGGKYKYVLVQVMKACVEMELQLH